MTTYSFSHPYPILHGHPSSTYTSSSSTYPPDPFSHFTYQRNPRPHLPPRAFTDSSAYQLYTRDAHSYGPDYGEWKYVPRYGKSDSGRWRKLGRELGTGDEVGEAMWGRGYVDRGFGFGMRGAGGGEERMNTTWGNLAGGGLFEDRLGWGRRFGGGGGGYGRPGGCYFDGRGLEVRGGAERETMGGYYSSDRSGGVGYQPYYPEAAGGRDPVSHSRPTESSFTSGPPRDRQDERYPSYPTRSSSLYWRSQARGTSPTQPFRANGIPRVSEPRDSTPQSQGGFFGRLTPTLRFAKRQRTEEMGSGVRYVRPFRETLRNLFSGGSFSGEGRGSGGPEDVGGERRYRGFSEDPRTSAQEEQGSGGAGRNGWQGGGLEEQVQAQKARNSRERDELCAARLRFEEKKAAFEREKRALEDRAEALEKERAEFYREKTRWCEEKRYHFEMETPMSDFSDDGFFGQGTFTDYEVFDDSDGNDSGHWFRGTWGGSAQKRRGQTSHFATFKGSRQHWNDDVDWIQAFEAYTKAWKNLGEKVSELPYPTASLQPEDLLEPSRVTEHIVGPPMDLSDHLIMIANVWIFFMKAFSIEPVFSRLDPSSSQLRISRLSAAGTDRLRNLRACLRAEKLKWHSDKLGGRNDGCGDRNEKLIRDDNVRAVFDGISELDRACQSALDGRESAYV
ncbi:hypothetical protein M501DRAFT_1005362 [Patellaria atrata CBS 101060]|uniref:Uncharacterized protein n=1 Tax=Patellaria atrata CBS 101060 TaxID=1346257 RepID=A0A9P4S2A5_9PEZI|nr:hypothetical protein M501DRAFT_1005362 [Patellaria atrata CBS 101060]